jgi:isopentenyl diphosphate isomerase/L-lactate dehydrogenase-like FMN-dependent dehydrogenase
MTGDLGGRRFLDGLEQRASEGLPEAVYRYVRQGARDGVSAAEATRAWDRFRFLPQVMRDVTEVDTRTSLLGTPVRTPLAVAPTTMQRAAHPDGEVAMARAAAAAGTVMCLSTIATSRPREVCAEAPAAPRWFQLYCFSDRGITRSLIDEAVECGFDAIALTVDAPRAGRRERDFRTGFAVPPDVTAPAIAAAVGSDRPMTPQEVFELVDASLDWDDFAALAADCQVPVLVKGIQTAEDARLAVEHGAAGVVVSNHGGRQLDGVPASLDMLPEVVEAVDRRCEVLMDGGIRRGTDVVIALALGAKAVLAGRAPLWGLAVKGESGARRVLEILRDEITLALTLLGCPSPADVTVDHVQRAPIFDT